MHLQDETLKQVVQQADCLYTASQVEQALDRLGTEISAELGALEPIVICVMNGGLIPMGRLLPRLEFQLEVDYVHATRYRNRTTGSALDWKARPHRDIRGRVLLVVDDILDEGLTLQAIVECFQRDGAQRVYTAVLVDKLHQRKTGLARADFVGLTVEDRYVFGYGMDYKGFLRNANGIFAVKDKHAV